MQRSAEVQQQQQLFASCTVSGSLLVRRNTGFPSTRIIASCLLCSCQDVSHTGVCLSNIKTQLVLCQDRSPFVTPLLLDWSTCQPPVLGNKVKNEVREAQMAT